MFNRIATACLAGVMGLVVGLAPAAAQEREIERYDVEVGVKYSLLQEEDFGWATKGLLADVGFKVCAAGEWRCQVVGEFAVHAFEPLSSSTSHRHTQVAGGLRLGRLSGDRMRPFVQFMIGRQSCSCGSDATTIQFGGGVNVGMTDTLDLQVQADLPFARYSGNTVNQFRLSAGIALPVGRR